MKKSIENILIVLFIFHISSSVLSIVFLYTLDRSLVDSFETVYKSNAECLHQSGKDCKAEYFKLYVPVANTLMK